MQDEDKQSVLNGATVLGRSMPGYIRGHRTASVLQHMGWTLAVRTLTNDRHSQLEMEGDGTQKRDTKCGTVAERQRGHRTDGGEKGGEEHTEAGGSTIMFFFFILNVVTVIIHNLIYWVFIYMRRKKVAHL